MAGIIDGVWKQFHQIPKEQELALNNWVTHDGQVGQTGHGGFAAEVARYHYYSSRGCPNCHRVAIALSFLGVGEYFSSSYVADVKKDTGWRIDNGNDPVFSTDSLQNVMVLAEGPITAQCTVPLLIDKKTRRLVSAQSDDMVRMMDSIAAHRTDGISKLWPNNISSEIDEMNKWIRSQINSGVYRILFGRTKNEKRAADQNVIQALRKIDDRLSDSSFIFGSRTTASDIWLFPTLLRIDSIYSEIFGLSVKIAKFSHLSRYLQDLWKIDSFRSASELGPIEEHYFESMIHGPHGPVEPGAGKNPDAAKRFALPTDL